jgi:hypothetical protein
MEDDGIDGGTEDRADRYTIEFDNEFARFPVRRQLVLTGLVMDDAGRVIPIRRIITVLNDVEVIAGVTTRVVRVREEVDGEPRVVSRNCFAQSPEGLVRLFGRDVDVYENGEVVSNVGSWRADGETIAPGIYMPAYPVVGRVFQRELVPGIATEMAAITGVERTVAVPFWTFDGCLELVEWNPLEGATREDGDRTVYAPGVGLVADGTLELTAYNPGRG